jgi:DNA-binding HxlR family transcriptional regulator
MKFIVSSHYEKESDVTMENYTDLDTLCPVARAETIVGDRWTVLVLRELFIGSHRFDEIQAQTGATPQMVTARLKKLETDGLIERWPYSQRPLRYEYHLTEKGKAFYPVILALRAWGETWCKAPGESLAVHFTHRVCGHPAGLGPNCEACGQPLQREDLIAEQSPAYQGERKARWEAFKARR